MSTTVLSPSESKTDLFKISKPAMSKKKSAKDEQSGTIPRIVTPIERAPNEGKASKDSKRKNRSSRNRKWSKNQCGDGLDLVNTAYSASSNPSVGHYEALPLLKQRLGYFWEKKMFTDVVFKVGPEGKNVEAHRTILASGAEYFQKLLYSSDVTLCDGKFILQAKEFSVPAFEAFIKAFYTNEFSICLTLPVALEVFQATKKYQIGFLQDNILDHIRSSVTVANIFDALQFSMTSLELAFVGPMCWKIIEHQTKEVLDYHVDSMDSTTLIKVLERDQLSLKETELYQYLVKWGSFQCKQQGIKVTGKAKRQFIEPLLKYIRFPTMTLGEVENNIIPSRILEGKEIQAIQASINGSDISKLKQYLPYKTSPRQFVKLNETSEVEEEIKPTELEPIPSPSASIPTSNKCRSDSAVTKTKLKKTRRVPSSTKSTKSFHTKLNSSGSAAAIRDT